MKKTMRKSAGMKCRSLAMCLAILAAVLLSGGILAAQTPEIDWVRQFGTIGPASDNPTDIDAYGNIYVVGYGYSTLPGQIGDWKENVFVCKYGPDGTEIWTRQFGTEATDRAFGVSVDATGISVAGDTSGALPGQTNAGYTDAFVRKYDFDGNELWTRQFGFAGSDQANALSADDTGIYVAGSANGTFPGQTSAGYIDAFVRKYDFDGNELWTRQFGTSTSDFADAICADDTGVYVASHMYSRIYVLKYDCNGNWSWTDQFGTTYDRVNGICADGTGIYVAGTTNSSLPGQTSAGSTDAFIRKYDFGGNEVWTRQFGTSSAENASSISADGTGIYVVGYTTGTLPGQLNFGGTYDAFIRKYNNIGNELWTRQFGTSGYDVATAITIDATWIYLAGETTGIFPGQPYHEGKDVFMRKCDSNGNEVWTRIFGFMGPENESIHAIDAQSDIYVAGGVDGVFPGQVFVGAPDAFVRKFDAGGNELWTQQFGTVSSEEASAIAANETGIYVAGWTYGTMQGQIGSGDMDAFVRKYDFDGNHVWTRQFGTSSVDGAYAISTDSSGIYVAGETIGVLPGQTNAGSVDAFVRKYDFDGNEVWTRQFGTQGLEHALGICADPTGIYIAGRIAGAFPGQMFAGLRDVFVRKYDFYGNEIWTHQFGTPGWDEGSAISADDTGIYVAGYTEGTLPGQTKTGNVDAFVRKYDALGNELWTHQFGDGFWAKATAISADGTEMFVSGICYHLPGQPSAGELDAFVCAYDTSGNYLQTLQFGTSKEERAYAISSDAIGIYVGGYTMGTFPGQNSAGGADSFVVKIKKPNTPPMADAGPDITVITCESASFNGNGSSDPDGTISSYQWNFGDGTTASGIQASHAYATAGVFTVTLTVTDNLGGTGTDNATVTVITVTNAIQKLIDLVASFNLQQGINNSLDVKLQQAKDAKAAANANLRQDAQSHIQAFINEVNAQRGKALTEAQADQLIYWALRIVNVIVLPGC